MGSSFFILIALRGTLVGDAFIIKISKKFQELEEYIYIFFFHVSILLFISKVLEKKIRGSQFTPKNGANLG